MRSLLKHVVGFAAAMFAVLVLPNLLFHPGDIRPIRDTNLVVLAAAFGAFESRNFKWRERTDTSAFVGFLYGMMFALAGVHDGAGAAYLGKPGLMAVYLLAAAGFGAVLCVAMNLLCRLVDLLLAPSCSAGRGGSGVRSDWEESSYAYVPDDGFPDYHADGEARPRPSSLA